MEQHLFKNRSQSACTSAAQQREIGNVIEGVLIEFQFHTVDLEQPLVLLDEGVLRFGQHLHQGLAIQLRNRREDGKSTDEFRDHAELQQVLGHHMGKRIGDVGLILTLAVHKVVGEAEILLAQALLDDRIKAGEGSTHDEQHIGGVDLDEFLMRMLAASLRWNRRSSALEDLQ